jgi:hypothetical protein
VEFLVCSKSKYLSNFSARRVFRHAGTDVKVYNGTDGGVGKAPDRCHFLGYFIIQSEWIANLKPCLLK